MKRIIVYIFSLLAVLSLGGCGDIESEGLTSVNYYPKIIINGESFFISPIGEPYSDAGATATLNGEEYSSKLVTAGVSDIDINKAGLYYVTYSATSPDGYSWSEKRTVAVCDPSITTDLGGAWTTQAGSVRTDNDESFVGCQVKIKTLCPGVFSIDDFMAGFYQQHRYGPDYKDYVLSSSGIFQLTADNKLELISSKPVSAFGDTEGTKAFSGNYDPDTQTITFDADVLDFTFHVILKK